MSRGNGIATRRTFVSELGSAALGSEYFCRGTCTRCHPIWRGPRHRLSDFVRQHVADPEAGITACRDAAIRDVLAHCDALHDGRLYG